MKLHHIGIVVKSIEASLPHFTNVLELSQASDIVYDPAQDSRLVMLRGANGNPDVELIEPASPRSPVAKIAARGGGIAHMCYAVANVDTALAELRQKGALVIQQPTPAVLFDQRRVAFLFCKGNVVIELVEQA